MAPADPVTPQPSAAPPRQLELPTAEAIPEVERDPLLGTIVGERYRILERIGEGGMGTVYRAEHTLMKKLVAVKLLHPELGRLDEAARRFEREAQSASRLSQDNIIQVTDFGRAASGSLFLVMELLRGESLADTIAQHGALPCSRAVAIIKQILRGLAHAHAEGVVHRDLKPENIMLLQQGTIGVVDRVKILDFGIAKMTEEASNTASAAQPLTQAGLVFGTPDYMAPEQAMGDSTDGRADLYACGVIFYELLTGRKPFIADTRVAVMSMHLTHRPAPPRLIAPAAGISPAIERIVLRALEKRREDRYSTATEFLTALDELGPIEHLSAGPGTDRLRALSARIASLAEQTRPARDRARQELVGGWKLLPARAQKIAIVAASAIAGFLLVSIAYATFREPRRPAAPHALSAELAASLLPVEKALDDGDTDEARDLLKPIIAAHGDEARVQLLLGNVEFHNDHPAEGLAAYHVALARDRGYRGDVTLLKNARHLLGDRKLGEAALKLLVDDVGAPACQSLAASASEDRRPEVRKLAFAACEKLHCTDLVDRFSRYSLDLQQGKTCEERREAVTHLRKLGDRRAIEVFKKAEKRRSGGGLFDEGDKVNDCIKKDLVDAIRALDGK